MSEEKYIIRKEQNGDEKAIHGLTASAFASMPFSNGEEPFIIDALRKDDDLFLSLVAEYNRTIIGHIAFSPISVGGVHNGWYGLGPISVEPEWQRQGIGKALITSGLDILKRIGANGCALIGNPAIYGSVGFASNGLLNYANLDTKLVQYVAFDNSNPAGELKFAKAFDLEKP